MRVAPVNLCCLIKTRRAGTDPVDYCRGNAEEKGGGAAAGGVTVSRLEGSSGYLQPRARVW